jgi:hypothetical protein
MIEEKPKHSVNEYGHYVLVIDSNYYKYRCKECKEKLPRKAEDRANHVCNPNTLSYAKSHLNQANKDAGLKYMYSKNDKGKKELAELDRCHVFDFETFVKSGEHKQNVYAYGIYNSVTGYKEDYGENSMDSFIEHILNIEPIYEESVKKVKAKLDDEGNIVKEGGEQTVKTKKPLYAIAYNGSRFDFHFVIGELTKREVELDNFIINNGAILGFSIKDNNLRFWDINQHIAGSLKKALKDFKCNTQKGDFDHFKITSWEHVYQFKDEWQPYLKSDVMGLAQLTEKYSNAVWNLFQYTDGLQHVRIDPKEFLTLPSAGYKIWQKTLFSDKKKDSNKRAPLIEIPNNDRDISDIRKASYGGRTYPLQRSYKSRHYTKIQDLWKRQAEAESESEKEQLLEEGKEIYKDLDDYIFNGDITSLYPTAMRYFKYPRANGTRIESQENAELTKNELKKQFSYSPQSRIVFITSTFL